jgi:Flp pilus assembly protein TadB
MSYLIMGIAALVLLLAAALLVAVKTAKARARKAKELEESLTSARDEIRRMGEYQKRKEEIRNDADAKKESIHTGDAAADFNASLGLLHGAAARGNKGSPPA